MSRSIQLMYCVAALAIPSYSVAQTVPPFAAASHLTERYGISASKTLERTSKATDFEQLRRDVPAVRSAETSRIALSTIGDLDRVLAAARAGVHGSGVAALTMDSTLATVRENARRSEVRLTASGAVTRFNSTVTRALRTVSGQIEDARLSLAHTANFTQLTRDLSLIQAGASIATGVVYTGGAPATGSTPSPAEARTLAEAGVVLVAFRNGVRPEDIERTLGKFALKVIGGIPDSGIVLAEIPNDLSQVAAIRDWDTRQQATPLYRERVFVRALKEEPAILTAALNVLVGVVPGRIAASVRQTSAEGAPSLSAAAANAVASVAEMWGLVNARFPDAWKEFGGDLDQKLKQVVVGVVDVGFNEHEALEFSWRTSRHPSNSHGNHVLGIIAAKRGNPKGLVGGSPGVPAVVDAPSAFNMIGGGNAWLENTTAFSTILSIVGQLCSDRPDVRVINLSLAFNWKEGGVFPDTPRQEAVTSLAELSAANMARCHSLIVSAAGNDADMFADFPARLSSPVNLASGLKLDGYTFDNVLVVEAHGQAGARSGFSNVGGDLSAPGESIFSATANNGYEQLSGTSQATPFVSSAAALIFALRPELTAAEVKRILISAGRASNQAGRPPMLDAAEAIRLARKFQHSN